MQQSMPESYSVRKYEHEDTMCMKCSFSYIFFTVIGIISTFSFLAVDNMDNRKFAGLSVVENKYHSFEAAINSTSFKPIQVCQKVKDNLICSDGVEQTTTYQSNYTIWCNFIDVIGDINKPINYPNTFKVLYYGNDRCHLEQDRYYPIQKELTIMLGCFAIISFFLLICCCCECHYFFCFLTNIVCNCCKDTSSIHIDDKSKNTFSKV
jgi:hypothetical protein